MEGGRRHDLLPQQRSAATLRERQRRRDLIRPVEGEGHRAVTHLGERDAVAGSESRRLVRRRDADDVPQAPAAQPLADLLDGVPCRRTRAEPHHLSRPDPVDGGDRSRMLEPLC